MNYRVIDQSGELLCESVDRVGADLAAEWFQDRGIQCSVEPVAPY